MHRHLGADSLADWLGQPKGWAVLGAGSKRGYRMLEVGPAMKQLGPTDLKRLHREWGQRTTGRLALLLDGVQSPFNVGAIVRTAAAYRVEHIYLGAGRSPATAKAGKLSMGTERYLSWSAFDRGPRRRRHGPRRRLQRGRPRAGRRRCPVPPASARSDVCMAIGHEEHGLPAGTLAACDAVAFIPQLGRVGSLNVATAAAIAIYELRRQDWV